MKVLNFGSLNLDYVYQVESILIPGETQASRDRQTFCGGKGLNQSTKFENYKQIFDLHGSGLLETAPFLSYKKMTPKGAIFSALQL